MSLSKATSRTARSGRALFLPSWFSYLPLYRMFVPLAVLSALLCIQPLQASTPLELRSDTATATAGYYQLRWDWPVATPMTQYVLEERVVDNGEHMQRMIYRGTDTASVISGKPDGVYEYTVHALNEQQLPVAHSEHVQVVVEHHSLTRAIGFFIIGVVVFAATLLVILRGAARHKQE